MSHWFETVPFVPDSSTWFQYSIFLLICLLFQDLPIAEWLFNITMEVECCSFGYLSLCDCCLMFSELIHWHPGPQVCQLCHTHIAISVMSFCTEGKGLGSWPYSSLSPTLWSAHHSQCSIQSHDTWSLWLMGRFQIWVWVENKLYFHSQLSELLCVCDAAHDDKKKQVYT